MSVDGKFLWQLPPRIAEFIAREMKGETPSTLVLNLSEDTISLEGLAQALNPECREASACFNDGVSQLIAAVRPLEEGDELAEIILNLEGAYCDSLILHMEAIFDAFCETEITSGQSGQKLPDTAEAIAWQEEAGDGTSG